MTKLQNIQLNFFMTRSLYLGGIVSIFLLKCSQDTWISIILGYIIGIILIYFNSKVNYHNNNLIKILLTIFYLIILIIEIMTLTNFIYSYLLPYSNIIITTLPFLFLIIYLSNQGINAIIRTSQILFFISIIIIIIKFFTLLPYSNFSNFLPIMNTSFLSIIKSSIIYAFISTCPYLLFINNNFKTNLISYSLSNLTILLLTLNIIGILGSNLSKIFAYPEYVILRQISIFNFIENVENFFVIIWFFDIFITMSLFINKINIMYKIKYNYIPYILISVLLLICNKLFLNNYINNIILYKNIGITISILSLITYIILFIQRKKE